MRRLVVTLSLLLAMLGAASGIAQAQEPVTFEFLTYLTGPDGAYYAQLVDQFNEEHPDIHVNFSVQAGGADYDANLTLAIRSGNAPAAAMLSIDGLRRYIDSDFIFHWSVDEWQTAFNVDMADYVPSTIAGAMRDDQVYAIPLAGFHAALYYNEDLFTAAGLDPEHPPKDWDEFLQYAQALTKDTDGDGTPDQWGFMCFGGWPYRVLWQWYSQLWERGGQLLNEDQTEVAFNSEAGIAALQYFVDLIQKDKVCPAEPADGEQAFGNGTLGMHINGPWMINYFDTLPDLHWKVANLPMFDDHAAAWGSVHTMVFPRGVSDEAHQAALVFGAFMADHTLELAAAGAYSPRFSVLESADFRALTAQAAFGDGAEAYLRNVPNVAIWPQAEQILLEHFDGANLGTTTVEEAIQGAADEIQALLQE